MIKVRLPSPAKLAKYVHEFEIEADLTRGFQAVVVPSAMPLVSPWRVANGLHYTAQCGQQRRTGGR